MTRPVTHIKPKDYLKKLLSKNPLAMLGYGFTIISTLKYRWIFKCVGRKTVVGFNTVLNHPSNIQIGSHCLILDNVYVRTGMDGYIKIGNHCAINSFAKIFAHGGVIIEDNVQIGPDCLITTTTHDYSDSLKAKFLKVYIKEWAWIGGKSTILPGLTIGEYSVIGAGSVVTKDVPPCTIVAGNPARVIREISKRDTLMYGDR